MENFKSEAFLNAIEVLLSEKPKEKSICKAVEELNELSTKLMQFINKPDSINDGDIEEEIVDVEMHLIMLNRLFPVSEEIRKTKIEKMINSNDYNFYLKKYEKNKLIRHKLETIRWIQEKYPNSHVGGSIGLYLRGIDLKRDLSLSDLDITIDSFDVDNNNGFIERSDWCDFDYAMKKQHEDGLYTKIDIRVTPEPSFDIIEFEGKNYNVSKLNDILFWKKKYADKGVKKHQDDLITIETGVRPPQNTKEYVSDDDLPF